MSVTEKQVEVLHETQATQYAIRAIRFWERNRSIINQQHFEKITTEVIRNLKRFDYCMLQPGVLMQVQIIYAFLQ